MAPAQTWFAEDFDSFLPAGWTQQNAGVSGQWESGLSNSGLFLVIEDMAFHSYSSGQNDDRLVSPVIDLTSASAPVYVHWLDYKTRRNYMAHHASSLGNGVATLEASTDGGLSWTALWTETRETGDVVTPTVDLSSYAGSNNLQLGFHYTGDSAFRWGIDELRVDGSSFGSVRSLVNPTNGHTYLQCFKASWSEARQMESEFGGHLVTIEDAAENTWVWQNFSKWSSFGSTSTEFVQRSMWMGATDEVTEGSWLWVDGSPFTYTNWSSGEPNNSTAIDPNGEDYLRLDSGDGRWLDKHPVQDLFVVLEMEGPIYTTTTLTGGQSGTFSLADASPFGTVLLGYSLTGAGPTATVYGAVDMSPPINVLATLTADINGSAQMTVNVPPNASGLTLYTQALDLASASLSNSLAIQIL